MIRFEESVGGEHEAEGTQKLVGVGFSTFFSFCVTAVMAAPRKVHVRMNCCVILNTKSTMKMEDSAAVLWNNVAFKQNRR